MRVLVPEAVPRVLVTDTVGFIKNLPHDLVASFKSTLEEAAEASLLLHVVDSNDLGFERQLEVTEQVLAEIGAGEVPRLLVFNKIDQAGDAKARAARTKALRARYPKCIVVSAVEPEAVAQLHAAIMAVFRKRLAKASLFLPWSAQNLRGQVFASCEVVEEQSDADGTFFTVRAERKDIDALRERIGPEARRKPPG